MLQKTANSAMQVRSKIESLIRAVLSLDQTIGQVNRLLGEIELALAKVNQVVVTLQPVLEKADVTLDQVDATIEDLGLLTPKMGEIVGQVGDVVQTFSPAFAVNDVLRRQLVRIRLRHVVLPSAQDGRGLVDVTCPCVGTALSGSFGTVTHRPATGDDGDGVAVGCIRQPGHAAEVQWQIATHDHGVDSAPRQQGGDVVNRGRCPEERTVNPRARSSSANICAGSECQSLSAQATTTSPLGTGVSAVLATVGCAEGDVHRQGVAACRSGGDRRPAQSRHQIQGHRSGVGRGLDPEQGASGVQNSSQRGADPGVRSPPPLRRDASDPHRSHATRPARDPLLREPFGKHPSRVSPSARHSAQTP
jgi:hypothetical protein